MDNQIREIMVIDQRLDFAESELRLAVYPQVLTPTTEVKGRLMGPSSAYTSTVEVAYHWRELSRGADHIVLRTVIPEPCFWEPQKAFLYGGPLELWQDGRRCDQRVLTHALRQVRSHGSELHINGKKVTLRSTRSVPETESQARDLHEQGFNALVAPAATPAQAELAERCGFILLEHDPSVTA
jgi:hypothetical protein